MPLRGAPRPGPALSALFVALFVLTLAGRAFAWIETHVLGDEVRVEVERSGRARVEHLITLKTAGEPLRAFDIVGVEEDAAPEPDGYVVPLRDAKAKRLEGAIPVVAELVPPSTSAAARTDDAPLPRYRLRLRFDGTKGLTRGTWALRVRYATNLGARGLIAPAGAMTRITWVGPVWDDGLDSARVTFAVPASPTEPRTDEAATGDHVDPTAPNQPTILSVVRRGASVDEIELLRPYVARGEPVPWAIRVDPRTLDVGAPRPVVVAPEEPARYDLLAPANRHVVLGAAGGVTLVYALLVALKGIEVRRHARAAGVEPRPVVPLPLWARAPLAGLSLAGGLALQVALRTATAGAALVAVATALAAHRTPRWPRPALRKPGRWLSITEAEAFRALPRPKGALLDVSTRAGKALFVLAMGGVGAGVLVLAEEAPYFAHLLALDGVAVLVLFGTGRIAELPPDPAVRPIPMLREVAKRVRRGLLAKGRAGDEVRLVPRIRVPAESPDVDEIRLAVVPKRARRGFVAIEVGAVYAPGAGGALELPSILVRVTARSECEQALARIARHGRVMRGRTPSEQVVVFSPRLPTARMTAAIVTALCKAVRDPDAEAPTAKAEPSNPERASKAKPAGRAPKPAAESAPQRKRPRRAA